MLRRKIRTIIDQLLLFINIIKKFSKQISFLEITPKYKKMIKN